MSRETKEQFISQMRADLTEAAGVLFVDYTGLNVAQANTFRGLLRTGEGVTYKVVKNTLMARAVEGTPFAGVAACLAGTPTGVVVGHADPVSAAKLTYAFAKDNAQVRVKGGIVEQRAISATEAEALSKLPSRAELQGSIIALAKSPGARLAGALKHPAGRLVGAIEALADRLGGASEHT